MVRSASAIAITAVLQLIVHTDAADENKSRHLRRTKEGAAPPQPVIYDTDYGPFIDDIFSLGLLANSGDLLDLKYVLTTGENPTLGAQCAAKHLDLAQRNDIPVGIGAEFPDADKRGGICNVNLGFALEERCSEGADQPVDAEGIAKVAELLESSERDDWWYIVVGGQTSLRKLVEEYPAASAKMSTLIVMGGNWCSDFEPYPGVMAPVDETNIACDPAAANMLVDSDFSPFSKIYYVPVVVADEIGGDDYMKIVQAANSGASPNSAAVLDFYRAWSVAGRADSTLLIHEEAKAYDPETESTPQFDACAVMLAIELLDDESCDDRLSLFEFDAIHFLDVGDEGLADFPDQPRAAFSLVSQNFDITTELPEQCPAITDFNFDPAETVEDDMPVVVPLGFVNQDAKDSFYGEMAERIAGTFGGASKSPKCYKASSKHQPKAPKKSKATKKKAKKAWEYN